MIEAVRLELRATDKYLKFYQPINTVTEINKLFQGVFTRKRHLQPLEKYTSKRQTELRACIDELKGQKLDKCGYDIADLPVYDRRQSVNSDYIRDTVNIYR